MAYAYQVQLLIVRCGDANDGSSCHQFSTASQRIFGRLSTYYHGDRDNDDFYDGSYRGIYAFFVLSTARIISGFKIIELFILRPARRPPS